MPFELRIDSDVLHAYPNYSAVIVYASGLRNASPSPEAATLLRDAQTRFLARSADDAWTNDPHLVAWRACCASFGGKPRKFPCSVESLLRRVAKGVLLPSISPLVDVYNAVSVEFVLPVGGEDRDQLRSDLVLRGAGGAEPFDTIREGEPHIDRPAPGEIVWADDAGVTCRAWNWRQCTRTALRADSRNAYFVLDRLAPYSIANLEDAAGALIDAMRRLSLVEEVWAVRLGE